MTPNLARLGRLRIEPLDRHRHDRAAFSCGEPRIDAYLKTRAAGLMDVESTRVWVACLDAGRDIVGFYALNAHGIDASALPPELRKRLPSHHPIPAIFLSNIGVTSTHQGAGVGSYLLADAFARAASVADQIGAAFIVLDALSEAAARFYRRHGFIDLPDPAGRMVIAMRHVRLGIETSREPSGGSV